MPNVTANQHYVWQYYLRAWCTPKMIWCKRSDRPDPFQTTTRNIGAERFFYKFHELTPQDVAYLQTVISQSNDETLRELNLGWIESFQMTFMIRQRLNTVGIHPNHRLELETKLEEIEKTLGEKFHGGTETRALPILDALREEDLSFYSDEEARINFIDYISHQYFRTAKLRNAVLAIPNPLPHDPSRTWPIEAFIYATNLASSFVRTWQEYRIVLMRNKSNLSFVTGDQPIINLRGVHGEKVDLYYPLKPDLAMVFTSDRAQYSGDHYDLGQVAVETYNHHIFAKSDSQMYGNDPDYLKALAQLPKLEQL